MFLLLEDNASHKGVPDSVPNTKRTPLPPSNSKAMAILAQSLARISTDNSNTASPVWKKVQVKDVASYKTIFNGMDEWDKVDEMVAIGRRIYDRSEVEVRIRPLFFRPLYR